MSVPATLVQNINFNSSASSSELAFELKNYTGGVINKQHYNTGSVDFEVFASPTAQGTQPTIIIHSLYPIPFGYTRIVIKFEYSTVSNFSSLATYRPVTIDPVTKELRQGDGVIKITPDSVSDGQPITIGNDINTEITLDVVFVVGNRLFHDVPASLPISENHYAGIALTNILGEVGSAIKIKEFRIINTPFPFVRFVPSNPMTVTQPTALLNTENIGGMYGAATTLFRDDTSYNSNEVPAAIATPTAGFSTLFTNMSVNPNSTLDTKQYFVTFIIDDNIGTEWSRRQTSTFVRYEPAEAVTPDPDPEPEPDPDPQPEPEPEPECSICILGVNKTETGILILPTINASYEYSLDGINFQSSPEFNGIEGGNYTITARKINDKSCFKSFNFSIFKLVNVGDSTQFTISYSPKIKAWASFHDYTPSYMIELTNEIISINNKLTKKFYSHNDFSSKAKYYLGEVFESVIEQPINVPELSKFFSYNWETEVYTLNGVYKFLETFTSMLIYNNRYCTSYISKLREIANNDEDVFSFNKAFNDLRLANKAFLDKQGKPRLSLLGRDNIKQGHIRGKFIIIKMIYDNIVQRELYVKNISAKFEKDGLQEK